MTTIKTWEERIDYGNTDTTEQMMQAEINDLRSAIEVLLGHMDTISKCRADPAISSLARVVLERFNKDAK
jgi:hypothetical protein